MHIMLNQKTIRDTTHTSFTEPKLHALISIHFREIRYTKLGFKIITILDPPKLPNVIMATSWVHYIPGIML